MKKGTLLLLTILLLAAPAFANSGGPLEGLDETFIALIIFPVITLVVVLLYHFRYKHSNYWRIAGWIATMLNLGLLVFNSYVLELLILLVPLLIFFMPDIGICVICILLMLQNEQGIGITIVRYSGRYLLKMILYFIGVCLGIYLLRIGLPLLFSGFFDHASKSMQTLFLHGALSVAIKYPCLALLTYKALVSRMAADKKTNALIAIAIAIVIFLPGDILLTILLKDHRLLPQLYGQIISLIVVVVLSLITYNVFLNRHYDLQRRINAYNKAKEALAIKGSDSE